jgi:hypothetical protein
MEMFIELSEWHELDLLVLQNESEFDEDTSTCLGNKNNKTYFIIYDGFALPAEITYLCPISVNAEPTQIIEYFKG